MLHALKLFFVHSLQKTSDSQPSKLNKNEAVPKPDTTMHCGYTSENAVYRLLEMCQQAPKRSPVNPFDILEEYQLDFPR